MKKTLIPGLLLVCLLLQARLVISQTRVIISQRDLNSWQQFRGNNRNGISQESDLVGQWPDKGPELVWKKEIGTAFSELLVLDDRIYTMCGEKTDSVSGNEYAVAFDANTGKELWKTRLDSIFIDVDNWGDGSRATPALDGQSMYCVTGFGKLTAVSLNNGQIQWQVDFVKEYGTPVPRWGFSSSPMLINDVLVVEVGGKEENAFMGFDKKTGKKIWANATGQPSYCSPIVANINGQKQIVFANGNTLYAFNANGETLWSYNMPLRSPTASPVFIAPDKIFVSSVSSTGCFIVKIEDNKAIEVMNNSSMKNHWSSSCYYNGYIYGFNVAALQCISVEDGSKKWVKRGFGKGSLILVGDKLLVLSDKGVLMLVEARADAYTELSSFQALDGKSWTAPSFANGKVYLRNLTEMACYKLK